MSQYVLKAHLRWKVLSSWHTKGKCFDLIKKSFAHLPLFYMVLLMYNNVFTQESS